MTGSSGDTLTISLSQPLDPSTVYCYTVTLPNGGIILAIEGKLRTSMFHVHYTFISFYLIGQWIDVCL